MNTHFIGKITEQQVILSFLKRGYQVSQPVVNDCRYDIIIDINNRLYRIQIKTSRLGKDNAYIEFTTRSSHTNTKGTINKSYNIQEIDYFATYWDNQCYIIPVDECGKESQRLRLLPPINGNQHGTKYAKNYTIEKFLETLSD